MSNWRPIETCDAPYAIVWDPIHKQVGEAFRSEYDDQWYWVGDDDCGTEHINPTQWQPLPEPPK